MHKDIDLSLKNISKIEGHTHLDVKVREGKVVECKLKISENKRFFTQAVTGLKFNSVPVTMSRICGTCSSAHALCSIEAVESDSQDEEVVATDNNVIVTRVYDNFKDGCLRAPDQVRQGGNCDYLVNEEKKCYRIERRGCNEVKVEVSCYERLEQVKGEGKCFDLPQREVKCYDVKSKGCKDVLSETSCFEDVDEVRGCPGYDCPVQVLSGCERKGSRVVCG